MPEENNNSQISDNKLQQPAEQKISLSETDAKIAELEATAGQLKDQLLRKAAEFENYKKRMENEIGERIKFANEELLFELLPVIDDFERSLKMSKERNSALTEDVFYRGIDLIYQKLTKVLESQGMKHYEVVGKQFDTHYHDALMQIPKQGVPPHTIIEEVEKGYMVGNKVLRHAKVIVAEDIEQHSGNNEEQKDSAENTLGEAEK